MKLAEIKAGEEYALLASNAKYRPGQKARFTQEQLDKGLNYRSKVSCMVYSRDFFSREWEWSEAETSLPLVKQTWAEYEIQHEAEKAEAEKRYQERVTHEQVQAKQKELLNKFLKENHEALSLILGTTVSQYSYSHMIEIKFTHAQLGALLERSK